jgi:hypothetical protein
MIAGLLVIGAVLLALPALSAGRRRRAPVEELVLFAASSLAAGALILEVGLALLALPTVLRSARLTGLADVCEHAFGALTITNPIVGWVATVSAVWIGIRAMRALAQARRATRKLRAEPWLGEHTTRGAFEVVTLPTSQLLAFNVDGNPPQVIVSKGLQAVLEPVDVERIIRHEQAHLRLRHRRYLLVAAAVDAAYAWLPPARLSIARLRTLLETAADETAAGDSIEERRALASLITQIICATGGPQSDDDDASRGRERVVRLEGRPCFSARATRTITLVPATLLLLAAIMLIAGWLAESHHAVALGSYCPD